MVCTKYPGTQYTGGVNFSAGSCAENVQDFSLFRCTQDDYLHTQFIKIIVIHNYIAKLTNLLFNSVIVHQIGVDIFGIALATYGMGCELYPN